MKLSISFVIAFASVTAVALVASCNGKNSTAKNLDGTWTGMPLTISDDSISMDYIPIITFEHQSGATGNVTVTAMLSVETRLNPSDSTGVTGWMSAAALATITGSYRVADNDRITLDLNPSSLTLTLDDDATRLTFDTLNPSEMPTYTAMRDSCAALLRSRIYAPVAATLEGDSLLSHLVILGDQFTAALPSQADPIPFRRQSEL